MGGPTDKGTHEMESGAGGAVFPPTRWSLVASACDPEASESDRLEALNGILRIYAPAMTSHLRWHMRLPHHLAEDVVQGFLTDKVLKKNLLGEADRARGRLRSLLKRSLERYAISELRRPEARASRQSVPWEPGSEGDIATNAHEARAGESLDIAWAREVLAAVMHRMRTTCAKTGRDDVWTIFEARIWRPWLCREEPEAYEALVRRMGLQSPSQATNLLVTAKRSFDRAMLDVVGEYTGSPERAKEEIRTLFEILNTPGAG